MTPKATFNHIEQSFLFQLGVDIFVILLWNWFLAELVDFFDLFGFRIDQTDFDFFCNALFDVSCGSSDLAYHKGSTQVISIF